MKRTKISALLSLMVALILILSTAIPVSAATVKISKAKATMEIDSTLTLKVSGTSSKVKWSSSNKTIAKVSSKGKVTALKEGSATIKATVDKKTYTCAVTVVDSNKTVSSDIKINIPSLPATVYWGSSDSRYNQDEITKVAYSNDQDYIYLTIKYKRIVDYNNYGFDGGFIVLMDENNEEEVYSTSIEGTTKTGIIQTHTYSIPIKGSIELGGTYNLRFVNDGYTPKPKDDDGNQKQDFTILLPSVPQNISYYSGSSVQSTAKVTNITYETSGTKATIFFTLEKIYDSRGNGQSASCYIGWKLYDSEGYIIDSGTFYSESMKVGDKQKNGKEYIYDLEKGETYKLEISNVN